MQIQTPDFDGPDRFFIVFHRDCKTWWVNRLIPDEFKHVSVVAFYRKAGAWLFYDPALTRTKILLHRNDDLAETALKQWFAGAVVVEVQDAPGYCRTWWRPIFTCIGMAAHFAGVKSRAVRPSAFLRDCLRNGGRIISDESQNPASAAA